MVGCCGHSMNVCFWILCLCKSCCGRLSYSVEASVSTVTSRGIQHDKTKLILITTKEDGSECNPPSLCRSRYLQLPESDGEVQHRWLHRGSNLQHHRCHQWGPAQLHLRPAQLHHPVRLHLHHAFHQPNADTGPQCRAAGRWTLDHPAGALWRSVRPAGPLQRWGNSHSECVSVFVQYRQHAVLAFKSKALSSTGLRFQFPQSLFYPQAHQLNWPNNAPDFLSIFQLCRKTIKTISS